MNALKIALLQMVSAGLDQDANLHKGEDFCRRAASSGVDIAVFPEMWNIGYQLPAATDTASQHALPAYAIGPQDAFLRHFQALAKELDMAIALTYLERWPVAPRDTAALIDRHGEIMLTYAKVHTCDFDREICLTPGESFPVCALDTRAGPVSVGIMICFDREFPESARLLMLNGAELILVPNACELEANRLAQLRSRAYENMLAVATANYAAPQENGHSIVYDGFAFDENGASLDTCLLEADEKEGVLLAGLDLDRLRAYRGREVWGNAFRKPRTYHALVSDEVRLPFVRPEARR